MTVAYAISRANLVIVPTQGSQLDAAEAGKAIRLIRQQERAFGRRIPYAVLLTRNAVLLTRTSAAIRPRTLQHIRDEMARNNVPVLDTHMHEREAFRAIFSFGGSLQALNAGQVSGLEAAIRNAHALAAEVVSLLKQTRMTAEVTA